MITVLVVEDEPQIRKLLAEILSYEGFAVLTAEDGQIGVEVAKLNSPDVIVCDIMMPELDGYGVLKELQADPQTATIPFIFLTALSDQQSLRNGMRLGADDYLVKPVEPEELFAAIRMRLAKRQVVQQWSVDSLAASAPAVGTGTSILASESTQLFNAGRTIGNYRLLQVIGEGASGIVFLCERATDGTRHAMKILKMSLRDKDEKAKEAVERRFVNEANAVSQLNHPHIVNFVEFGYSGSGELRNPYIVMEYFPGVSLARRLGMGIAWDYKQKVSVILQVASALAAVHGKSIVHRDIKPGNILVDDGLNVKITDFGICHLPSSDLTATSNILGTPCYLSPEYLSSGKADHLADIYSLGVVAYELLVGQRPFDAVSVSDLIRIIQKELPPEPFKIKPDFPPKLRSILAKMLKKKPKQRYQNSSELLEELVQYESSEGVSAGLIERITKGLMDSKDWK